MWRIALLLAFVIGACDGETVPGAPLGWGPASSTLYSPPTVGGGIVGDWFICRDETCTRLTNGGVRFEPDGNWTLLEAPDAVGGYVLGEEYCLMRWSGTYAWDGSTLVMHGMPESGDITYRVTFDGDIATATAAPDWHSYFRRVAAAHVEPCPVETPLPGGD